MNTTALELASPTHARHISHVAVRALLGELTAFPKPGLVSLVDAGSHADMSASHFVRSARSLRHYFANVAAAGARAREFDALRRLAVEAEVAMLRATGGVNTHRGAIFSVGLLAAAAGWRAARGTGHERLGSIVGSQWGAAIRAHRRDPASHGSAVTRRHGSGGAQAEAAAGFPCVYAVALPAYREVLRARLPADQAAVQAFFALMAQVDDTNLVHRGGIEGLRFAQRRAREFLAAGGMQASDGHLRALEVHRALVARRLSPGGCADLLAACLLVADLES